ncbi:MAG: NAAT family transporter [Phenylobacterium sp.]|uniref:MarC family protein n=1 Tax=Phenylobacterium sp. TaxID=1871053 RepID=UPI0025F245AB|nr:NAAT family transporter [Phenylobacterium sp.]MBI1200296.1 NAAT family transporter [Phenylobacterium sp.]
MALDLAFAIKVFAALFAIMNPIANIPVFLSLTEGCTEAQQRRIAGVALAGVTIGCAVSALAGGAILGFFGITVDDFRLAGGLLVLLIALDMLHGGASTQHKPTDQEMAADDDGAGGAGPDVAVYPLTMPLLVGPGTIATLVVFGQTAMAQHQLAGLAAGLVAFLALLGVSLFAAPMIGRRLSPRVTAIARRLMGMILAAIAVEMMVTSLRALFPGLAG